MKEETIDAQVVDLPASQALAVRPTPGLPTVADLEQSFQLAVRQRELLSDYIRKQLKPGQHFFQRGDQKPSLSKEGAEIILLPHNLAPDYELVSGPEGASVDDKPYQITVKCILRKKGDPNSFVGAGIGSAGSHKWSRNSGYQPRQPDKYLCHNATLKMAQKSAMIAATINSTAASEFFTQDMDDTSSGPPNTTAAGPRNEPTDATSWEEAVPAAAAKPASAKAAETKREATAATRTWMCNELTPVRDDAIRFFIELGAILPTEGLDELPLRYVPTTKEALNGLKASILAFRETGKMPAPRAEREWFMNVIVPIPRKGQKRADYLKNPDTIGSLYEQRHGDDEESHVARTRLWGFVNHFEPKGWTNRQGQQMLPSKADIEFRKALDAFQAFMEKNHPGEKL